MTYRRGLTVQPYQRLSAGQLALIHRTSLEILEDPGVLVDLPEAVEIFERGGARVTRNGSSETWTVKISAKMVAEALEKAPKTVVLGARDPANALLLDGRRPVVYFGTGSESNYCLETVLRPFTARDDPSRVVDLPCYTKKRGTVNDLVQAARLGENLAHLDFFIRPVNIQDEAITAENKDVNKFFACLDNLTKHVMAGLTSLESFPAVIRMAQIIAGGRQRLKENPVISLISCVTKSPLQFLDDATAKMLAAVREGIPVVLSSSPQGGSTAPLDEMGMVAQINAEILSAVVLSQLAAPGAPVIYGSVPVRARMDNLHDMYGAPEFNQYNVDCVQMARYYGIPCYSTAGVADAKVPGIQATAEKLFSHLFVAQSGPQLIHYAFGLLEETQTFSLEQAVLDNEHIGMVKMTLAEPRINQEEAIRNLEIIRTTMNSPYRLFARYARRRLREGDFYFAYPFESTGERDETMGKVKQRVEEILSRPAKKLPENIRRQIFAATPGIIDKLH